MVRVQAPDERSYVDAQFVGYLPFHGPFEFDSGSVERMTVWLERGGTIRVRLSPASSNFSALVIARRSGAASADDYTSQPPAVVAPASAKAPAAAAPATKGASAKAADDLPITGTDVITLVAVGGGLVLAGGAVLVSRRRLSQA